MANINAITVSGVTYDIEDSTAETLLGSETMTTTATTVTGAINELDSEVGAKSEVSYSQTLTSGTEIGAITIDGTTTTLLAPEGGTGTTVSVSDTTLVFS